VFAEATEESDSSSPKWPPFTPPSAPHATPERWAMACREREFFIDNLLVRIHLIVEMIFSRPALRHGSLNSVSQVALYLLLTRRHRAGPWHAVDLRSTAEHDTGVPR